MSSTPPPKRGIPTVVAYALVAVVLCSVVAVAWFQEQIGLYLHLQMWDRAAPGRVVVRFLEAAKAGDQAKATEQLGTKDFQPLVNNGKWEGYFIVSQAGKFLFPTDELAPADPAAKPRVDFITRGKGAAEVELPDAKNTPVRYRLEMTPGGWKIMEIRGGRPDR